MQQDNMAFGNLDTSGILRSLGAVQQQRNYEEQVWQQEQARKRAEWERKHARDKQKAAEKRARHTATMTAIGTVAGAAAGSFVPVVGTGLGAAIGGAAGTALSGGEISPGQIANIGTSAISQKQAYDARQQQTQTNKALLSSYSRMDPRFVEDSSFSKEDLMAMSTPVLQSMMQINSQAKKQENNRKFNQGYNDLLIDRISTQDGADSQAIRAYKQSMAPFRDASPDMQDRAHKMIYSEGVDPAQTRWIINTGGNNPMPQGFSRLDNATQNALMTKSVLGNNQVLGSQAYNQADPETKLSMLDQSYANLSTSALPGVKNYADKVIMRERNKLNKQIEATMDYAGLSRQVDNIATKENSAGINDGSLFPVVVNGQVQLTDTPLDRPLTKSEQVVLNRFLSKHNRFNEEAAEKTRKAIDSQKYDVGSLTNKFIKDQNLNPNNPEDLQRAMSQAYTIIKTSNLVGEEQALLSLNKIPVKDNFFIPSASKLAVKDKGGNIKLGDSYVKFASLPNEEMPVTTADLNEAVKQGVDVSNVVTEGDLLKAQTLGDVRANRTKKVETNIGKINPHKLAAIRDFNTKVNKINILSKGANSLIGPWSGGKHVYSPVEGLFDSRTRMAVSPEDFQALNDPGLAVSRNQDGSVVIDFSQTYLNSLISKANNIQIKDQSGATVTVPEFDRLKATLPRLNNFYDSFNEKARLSLINGKELEDQLMRTSEATTTIDGNVQPVLPVGTGAAKPVGQQQFDMQGNQSEELPDFTTMSDEQLQAIIRGE
jgi:uncharacterized membrane protein